MPDPLAINPDEPLNPGLDYVRLREEGIRLIQRMSGEVWTDYNETDPGVTTLEQLCYSPRIAARACWNGWGSALSPARQLPESALARLIYLLEPNRCRELLDTAELQYRPGWKSPNRASGRVSLARTTGIFCWSSWPPGGSADRSPERLSAALLAHPGARLSSTLSRGELEDIVTWTRHQETLMREWMLDKRLKPGFRALFHGRPGTGKTLAACLLGKATGLPVSRIDLAKVVSKYIGETEKNLASLFDHAQHQNWILFFDEADSLFGKRTESRNSNDRAANQQVSYLLQRIEDFSGTCLLATNQRTYLDEAFARRFQAMVHFGMPDAQQRLRLWEDCFQDKPYVLAAGVDLRQLANDHALAGGSIINVLRDACLKAIARQPPEIRGHDVLDGIRKEMHKEGKYLDVSPAD